MLGVPEHRLDAPVDPFPVAVEAGHDHELGGELEEPFDLAERPTALLRHEGAGAGNGGSRKPDRKHEQHRRQHALAHVGHPGPASTLPEPPVWLR